MDSAGQAAVTDRGAAISTVGASDMGLTIAKALLCDGWKLRNLHGGLRTGAAEPPGHTISEMPLTHRRTRFPVTGTFLKSTAALASLPANICGTGAAATCDRRGLFCREIIGFADKSL